MQPQTEPAPVLSRVTYRINAAVERRLPEQRLFLKSDTETRFIRLRPATQLLASQPQVRLDYVALVDPSSFEAVDDGFSGRALLLIAAKVGNTRLIDNLSITI